MYNYNGDNKFRIIRRMFHVTEWYTGNTQDVVEVNMIGKPTKYMNAMKHFHFSEHVDAAIEYLCYKDMMADLDMLNDEAPLEGDLYYYEASIPEDDEDTWKEWLGEMDDLSEL